MSIFPIFKSSKYANLSPLSDNIAHYHSDYFANAFPSLAFLLGNYFCDNKRGNRQSNEESHWKCKMVSNFEI